MNVLFFWELIFYMKYLFILNPISGGRKNPTKIKSAVDRIFQNSDHTYEFVFTSYAGEAKILSQNGAKDGFDVVVAAGGDGTINEVATGILGTEAALGIIPLGSGNGLARSFGVPLDLSKSIDFLINPKITSVDVGKANDHYFFGVCGLGYDAIVGKKFQEFGTRGPLPYFLIGIKELVRYKPEKVCLNFNDQQIEVSPLLITISNTKQYGNGAIISPNADPQDGKLEICIINMLSFVKAVRATRRLFNGTIDKIAEYSQYTTDSLQIVAEHENGVFHTDGEPHDRPKTTHIKLLYNTLKVCANL